MAARKTSAPTTPLPEETFPPPRFEHDTPTAGRRKRWLRIAGVVVFVAAIAVAYYFYTQYAALARDPNVVTQKEVQELTQEVGKLIVLPDETPTVATVSDAEVLRDQNFFRNAENGDKLLAYPVSRQAILYRPSTKKIIAVAPIVIDGGGQ